MDRDELRRRLEPIVRDARAANLVAELRGLIEEFSAAPAVPAPSVAFDLAELEPGRRVDDEKVLVLRVLGSFRQMDSITNECVAKPVSIERVQRLLPPEPLPGRKPLTEANPESDLWESLFDWCRVHNLRPLARGGGVVERERRGRGYDLGVPPRPFGRPAFGDEILSECPHLLMGGVRRAERRSGIEVGVVRMAGKALLLLLPVERRGVEEPPGGVERQRGGQRLVALIGAGIDGGVEGDGFGGSSRGRERNEGQCQPEKCTSHRLLQR